MSTLQITASDVNKLRQQTGAGMMDCKKALTESEGDFEKAIETTLRSSFQNQGQICLCGSRIFVEKSIYSKFRDALVERTRQLRQSDPLDAKTQQGSLVSEVHMKKVLSYLDIGQREGKVLSAEVALN